MAVPTTSTTLPRLVIRLTEIGQRQPLPFDLVPEAEGREALAASLGIVAIRKLRLQGRLTPVGRQDWRLDGVLGATVVQDCVVTLAPVTTRIDEPVARTYLAAVEAPDAGEVEMPEDDTIEALPQSLDLGEVMAEALALALPPYPRAPGAELGSIIASEPGVAPLTDEAARPFAGLRDALRRDD